MSDLPRMVKVTGSRPCPACKKGSWCLISPDGRSCICQRVESRKRCGEAGWLHRLDEPLPAFTPEYREPVKRSDWYGPATKYASQLSQVDRSDLALRLGLPLFGLDCIALLGAFEQGNDLVYVFPERDGQGNVIGLNRRYRDGTKKHMPGGARGVTLPNGWDEGDGPLFIVEGPTDTAAMMAADLKAIGRPSNIGGSDMLAEAIKAKIDTSRTVIVVGENDRKPDGLWPGLDGAISVAGRIQDQVKNEVRWVLAPTDYKDVREFLTSERFDGVEWNLRGIWLAPLLTDNSKPAKHLPAGYKPLIDAEKRLNDYDPDRWSE